MGLDDPHIASVFALGLKHGFAARDHMIQWADGEISTRGQPPIWLIDLSLSGTQRTPDVISGLEDFAYRSGTDPNETIRLAYALLPELAAFTSPAAYRQLAKEINDVTCDALGCDWTNSLVREVGWRSEEFDLLGLGYSTKTSEQLIGEVTQFVHRYRDAQVHARLHPVRWIVGAVPS